MPKTIPFIENSKTSTIDLPKSWPEKTNIALLSQVFNVLQNNKSRSTSHSKTRAEVSGTGKKPWKQKGTGRARHGSMRSPIWSGGGIVFGPRKEKNNTRHLTQKERNLALKMILVMAADAKHLIAIDKVPDVTKTKKAVEWLATLPIENGRLTIFSNLKSDAIKSFKNIPYVNLQSSNSPAIDEFAMTDWIIITKDVLENLHNTAIKIDAPVKAKEKEKVQV